jgi:hypothetical protein
MEPIEIFWNTYDLKMTILMPPSDQPLRAIATGLAQNDHIITDWEHRVTGGRRVRHPLIYRVHAVQCFFNVMVACGTDTVQKADQYARFADHAIKAWARSARNNPDEWGHIEEKAEVIVSDLNDAMFFVAEEVAAALISVIKARTEVYHQGSYRTPDTASSLVCRAYSMALCGEAIMHCTETREHAALAWVAIAQNQSKAVLSHIAVWRELEHLIDRRGNIL